MIVMKFGGSSLGTGAALTRVADIVSARGAAQVQSILADRLPKQNETVMTKVFETM